jgi:predicted Zn-dependent protease
MVFVPGRQAVWAAEADRPAALSTALPDLGDSAQAEVTPQLEKKVGEAIMREYRRDPDFIDDPEITAYVSSIGQRLVSVSADPTHEFEFFVVRDEHINAFAMPGGYVGINTGLILAAQTESELAGVLAHEISHVTQGHIARQLDKESQLSWATLAGLVVAVLAARSSPQTSMAAIVGSQAAAIQAMLSYSREYEQEADRIGFGLMEAAGFDPNGMPEFFGRLLRASRLSDLGAAPAYLRTHPLTTERMADLEARAAKAPYRQRPDSLEFQLVRMKIRAQSGSGPRALELLRTQLNEGRYSNGATVHYGISVALLRTRNFPLAAQELKLARERAGADPMFASLGARIRRESGDRLGARAELERAMRDFGRRPFLVYEYARTLQAMGKNAELIKVLEELLRVRPRDARAYQMLAESHAALGQIAAQHQAQGEYYALMGNLAEAVVQMQLAQKAGDGDFYLLSSVDARVAELKALEREERQSGIK